MVQTTEQQRASRPAGRDGYLADFEAFEKNLNGEASSHVHAIRKTAIARFAALGFPTTNNEEWKYTDVTALAKLRLSPVLRPSGGEIQPRDIEQFTFHNLPCYRLVCVNGRYSKSLSSDPSPLPGVRIESLADALKSNAGAVRDHLAQHARYDENAFTALSTAFIQDGAYISIPDGMILDKPVHLLFVSTDHEQEVVSHPRILAVVGKSAQVSIIESYESLTKGVYFTNAVSEVVVGENAIVEHDKLQNESDRAFHIAALQVHLERNSSFTSNNISLGGSLSRNTIEAVLDGEGAECTLNGLYIANGQQLVDNHTTIDHAKPHCPSHELYKGILSGKSRGVFNGKIKVRKDAQKTDAKQTNKNLVLSDDASIDTKPQLEIFANDVRCTHGATIGQIDDEAMFYLRSRGVGQDDARTILIYAFASDVVERVHVEPLRQQLLGMIENRLSPGKALPE
jgi:Fe-S cluster assembly protein SufD